MIVVAVGTVDERQKKQVPWEFIFFEVLIIIFLWLYYIFLSLAK